jgi:5'-3' exonuclease
MGTDHKKSSGSKKGLSAFEKAFAAARKKAGGPDGIFTFKTEKGLEKFTTAYAGEKIPKKNKKEAKSSGVSKTRMEGFEPLGKSKTILELGEAKKRAASRFKDKGAGTGAKGTISLTIIGVGQKELPKKVEPKPAIRAHVDAIKNQRERRAWEEKYGANYNNDGTLKKIKKTSVGSKVRKESRDKAKGMNVGGLTQSSMMNGLSRKINPATGLTMKKGGMIDYRKKGMFYGGGMARRGR